MVHDDIEEFLKQGEINVGKFLLHDGEVIRIDGIDSAAGVAAIMAVLGMNGFINAFIDGGGGGGGGGVESQIIDSYKHTT